jgi:hypothetical protein
MPTGSFGSSAGIGASASASADGARPVSSAIACSSCARAIPTSRRCASALFSCDSACATSARVATPAASRSRVSLSERSYDATVSASSLRWASAMRSWW